VNKIVNAIFTLVLLTSTVIITPIANSAVVVTISEPTHRLSSGVFIDDLLATKLLPAGDLGLLVYTPASGVRGWQVDPATISEIIAMSNGYGISDGQTPLGQKIAQDWLTQFKRVSKFEKVYALTYGSASNYWLNKISPNQLTYINSVGKLELDLALGRATEKSQIINGKRQKLTNYEQNIFTYAQRQINLLSTLVDKKELDPLQLRMAQLLNPSIDKKKLEFLVRDFDKLITQYRNKLKITGTKFTITSEKEELPITVINNFKTPVTVKLSTRVSNSKIVVEKLESIEIVGGEKRQVLLPIQALASGNSGLLAQLTNLDNKPVGYPVNIALNLSVISPLATWITSGAAILLIIAAMVQSWRRVRRRKNV
jgi:hypothetical protein